MEWTTAFWNDGLTDTYLSVTLDGNDIHILLGYLNYVTGKLNKQNPFNKTGIYYRLMERGAANFPTAARRRYDRGTPRDAGKCCACRITTYTETALTFVRAVFFCPNPHLPPKSALSPQETRHTLPKKQEHPRTPSGNRGKFPLKSLTWKV